MLIQGRFALERRWTASAFDRFRRPDRQIVHRFCLHRPCLFGHVVCGEYVVQTHFILVDHLAVMFPVFSQNIGMYIEGIYTCMNLY